ncbi:hypothetical protein IWGMT90018_36120 [Mycobacterium kiyosense]|nr:hypothetical protein IWGMT90018_36120 [Mycobacterium kiyosense]
MIPTDRASVTVNDDWGALGMRRTDNSGTVGFHDVERCLRWRVLRGPNAIINDFFQFPALTYSRATG